MFNIPDDMFQYSLDLELKEERLTKHSETNSKGIR